MTDAVNPSPNPAREKGNTPGYRSFIQIDSIDRVFTTARNSFPSFSACDNSPSTIPRSSKMVNAFDELYLVPNEPLLLFNLCLSPMDISKVACCKVYSHHEDLTSSVLQLDNFCCGWLSNNQRTRGRGSEASEPMQESVVEHTPKANFTLVFACKSWHLQSL